MTEQDDLVKQIPQTAKEFRFANMLFKVTRSKQGTVGFVFKNIDNSTEHYTLVAKNSKPDFHYTKEGNKTTSNQHKSIDYEYFLKKLGVALEQIFTDSEKIELTDPRFHHKNTILITGTRLIIDKATSKKVIFDQMIDYDDNLFENIDIKKNSFGVVLDDKENELAMLFVREGSVFMINLEELDSKSKELDLIMKPE